MRLEPQPPAEELRRYYPATYWFASEQTPRAAWRSGYRRLVLRDHVRFVARALHAIGAASAGPGPLLDVGCGGGLFLGMMRERGVRVVGLDFLDGGGECCLGPAAGACGVLATWRARPSPSTLRRHHHVSRARTSAPIRGHTSRRRAICWRRRGAWWCRCPMRPRGSAKLLGRSWNGVDVPRHLFDFRDRDMERLLEACGFEVVRRKYFSLRDNPAGLATSMAPGLDPMARRVRRVRESGGARLAKDLAYLALVAAAVPFAAIEAAFGRRVHGDDGGPAAMRYSAWRTGLPRPLRRHILHFECEIEDAVAAAWRGNSGGRARAGCRGRGGPVRAPIRRGSVIAPSIWRWAMQLGITAAWTQWPT